MGDTQDKEDPVEYGCLPIDFFMLCYRWDEYDIEVMKTNFLETVKNQESIDMEIYENLKTYRDCLRKYYRETRPQRCRQIDELYELVSAHIQT